MAKSKRRATLAILPLSATLASAVSLSDFTPALANVPDPCSSIYIQDINGCTPSDFPTNCSPACLQGMVAINQQLVAACSTFDAPAGSLINFFQNGVGIQVLCNVAVVTASDVSTAVIGQSTMTLASATSTSSSLIFDTSKSPNPPTTSSTLAATTMAPNTQSMAAITMTPQSTLTISSSTTSKTSKAPAAQSQLSGNGGSGGDPFAIQTNGSPVQNLPTALLSISLALTALSLLSL